MSRADRDFAEEDFIDYRERRGAHRPRSRGAMAALPWALAVVAVLALTFAATQIFGGSGDAGSSKAAAGQTPKSSAPAKSAEPEPSQMAPKTTAAPKPAVPKIDKTKAFKVLNATKTTGLAGKVGTKLKAAGWKVSGTGNFTGSAIATTVFYGTESLSATAAGLVKDLGDQGTATQSTKYGTGITVVVGSDYRE